MRRAAMPEGLEPVLAGVLVTAAAVAAATASWAGDGATPVDAVLHAACAVAFAAMGTIAWRRRPTSLTGPLLVLTGAALVPLPLLLVEDAPALRALGLHAPGWFGPPLAHLLLGFPGGRVVGRHRWVLRYAYAHVSLVTALVLLTYVPPASCAGCADGPWIGLLADRDLFEVLNLGHLAVSLALTGYVALAVVDRRRRATPAARRVFAPILWAGSAASALVGLTMPYLNRMIDGQAPPASVQALWTLAWLAVPAAVLVGLLRVRAARFDLPAVVRALDDEVSPLGLRDALARALGDPGAELGFWVPELAEHRDVHGRRLRLPLPGDGRATTRLGAPGTRGTAILVHDAALLEDDGLLDAVAGAAGLALEHERLHAELRTRLAEVRAARGRLVEAEDDARRRTERDLHDGAQQTLVSLALALRMLDDALDPDEDRAALAHAREAADHGDRALDELRRLARGVYPAVLHLDGLAPALEELAARAGLPVRLGLDVAGRPDPAVEAAAFFVVREALRNAEAHADAREVRVTARGDGTTLAVEVADDGHGGAALRERGSLRQLSDRCSALGGRLELRNPEGGGAVLRAELPWRAGYAAAASAAASAPADSWSLRTNGSPLSRSRVP